MTTIRLKAVSAWLPLSSLLGSDAARRAENARLVDVIRCAIVDLSDAAAMYGGSDGRPDMLKKVMLDNVTALKKALDWPMEAKA